MEIILLESLHKIGKAGEIVNVKDGYANNFLIPNKKAIVAKKQNKKTLDSRIVEINKKNDLASCRVDTVVAIYKSNPYSSERTIKWQSRYCHGCRGS